MIYDSTRGMIMFPRELSLQLCSGGVIEARRHQILKASIVADHSDGGYTRLGDVASGGRHVTEERLGIALGHEALRLLE